MAEIRMELDVPARMPVRAAPRRYPNCWYGVRSAGPASVPLA